MANAQFDYVMTMGEKMGSYVGEWSGMIDGKVIARGSTAKEVFDELKKKYPKKIPFVMKVPTDEVMLL